MKLILMNIICVLVKIHSYILKDLDYSPDYFDSSSEHKNNWRRTFLEKRRQNIVTARRLEMIDKYLSNNSVIVDGIMHEKIDKKHKQWKLVNKIEAAFRDLIGMYGVTYNFKRDSYWRTWRKIKYPKEDKMICYRCESSLNCSDCQYGGYWIIDENPPCPFEIVSVINIVDVCAIDFQNSTNVLEACPIVTPFEEIMRNCDNPIDTQWRIQKRYKKEVSERYPSIFCGGRDYCGFSTYYTITPQHVSFRIVNSTNHITYSKIMKNNRTNYACVSDCGILDPKTMTVSKTAKPLLVDLINGKNKREDKTNGSTVSDQTLRTSATDFDITQLTKIKIDKIKHAVYEMETAFNLPVSYIKMNNDDDDDHHRHC